RDTYTNSQCDTYTCNHPDNDAQADAYPAISTHPGGASHADTWLGAKALNLADVDRETVTLPVSRPHTSWQDYWCDLRRVRVLHSARSMLRKPSDLTKKFE